MSSYFTLFFTRSDVDRFSKIFAHARICGWSSGSPLLQRGQEMLQCMNT